MSILKELNKEYFGEKVRKEDEINIEGLNVKIVSFKDNNGNFHRRGYKPKDLDNLKDLLERMVEVRGDEGDFNDIDTTEIESMEALFYYNNTFNGDIAGWDVSRVVNMESMFDNATSFNQPIGKWDVSSVENMSFMFRKATSFNQPIGDWEFPNVTDMSFMFRSATSFNQDISDWKFPKVTNMNCMFQDATSFNQNISNWEIYGAKVVYMFYKCPIKDEYKPKIMK